MQSFHTLFDYVTRSLDGTMMIAVILFCFRMVFDKLVT